MNLISKILQKWMAWVLPRPRLVLGVAVLAALASSALAVLHLGIQTDQLELISAHHPLIALSKKLEPFNFDGRATFSVVVKAPTPARAVAFVSDLAVRIQKDSAYFRDVFYRVDPDLFKQWALLYLDKKDILRIKDNVEENSEMIRKLAGDPDLLNFLALVNREMSSKMVGELFTGFLDEEKPQGKAKDKEPMDLGFLIQTLNGLARSLNGPVQYSSPWFSFFKSSAWDLDQEGYFWEGGKRFLILIAIPAKLAIEGFSDTQHSLDVLRTCIADVKSKFPDVEAGVTGQEALQNDEMSTVLGDMTWATWLSLMGVWILLVLFLRGIRRPVIEVITLVVGLCWTVGWAAIFIGHLNILSVVFAPLLCGLGVDYGIHWIARFEEEEERHPSLDNRTLTKRVMDRSGSGILLAGLSAAFSFLPFILTGFSGLVELGLITGMGILLIILADFTVLPALAMMFAGRRKAKPARTGQIERDLLRLRKTPAHLILACMLVFCIVSLMGARKVRFDLNPLRLQAKNAESVVWERTLIDNAEQPLLSAAVFASSPEEVNARTELLKSLPSVGKVKSIFSLLPEDQGEKIPLLRDILPIIPEMHPASLHQDPQYVRDLIDMIERIRFKMQDDQAGEWGAERPLVEQMSQVRSLSAGIINSLRESPDSAKGLEAYRRSFSDDLVKTWDFLREGCSARTMTMLDMPQMVRDQFYRDGQYLIRISPKESIWEEDALGRFVHELQSVDPDVVGEPISLYVFASAFKKACLHASGYAVLAIFVLLMLTFRNVRLSILALIPLCVGTVWTIGVMGANGVDFNLANSIFMPLVVGAGVEYAIIILSRWEEGRMRPGHLPWSTGKGVILAALTTTVGFGTLMVSHHQGIFSLGFVAWVGSLCVLATAIFILPAILADMDPPKTIPKKEKDNEALVPDRHDMPLLSHEYCSPCGSGKRDGN